ncbi:MAG: ABC transporter permease [Acidimicrobiia bacterium]
MWQAVAFVRKELIDLLRQPRLLLTLIIGPFAVLLAFGLGYKQTTDPYTAYFVGPPKSSLIEQVRSNQVSLGSYVKVAGFGTDENAARALLESGKVDVVVVFPDDPVGSVLNGKQAGIRVLHDRMDPIEQTAIDFAARLAVDEVNGQVLAGIVNSGQQAAEPFAGMMSAADQAMQGLSTAVAAGDTASARQRYGDLDARITTLQRSVDATLGLVQQFDQNDLTPALTTVRDDLVEVRNRMTAIRIGLDSGAGAGAVRSDQIDGLAGGLHAFDTHFEQFTHVEAKVLVRPFVGQVRSVARGERTITDFYAPAAVMLLVQQFGVAFGALSFVRERQLGIFEVYRAAPLGASGAVIGKYIGYLVAGGVVAAALTVMVIALLGVPAQGSFVVLSVILALTLLASIGLGLVISLISPSDTQAVQYTMLVLLASLFFSGFFLALDALNYPARIVSWLLPATFGIQGLRDNMLRGRELESGIVAALAGYAAIAFVLTMLGARQRLRSERL